MFVKLCKMYTNLATKLKLGGFLSWKMKKLKMELSIPLISMIQQVDSATAEQIVFSTWSVCVMFFVVFFPRF